MANIRLLAMVILVGVEVSHSKHEGDVSKQIQVHILTLTGCGV